MGGAMGTREIVAMDEAGYLRRREREAGITCWRARRGHVPRSAPAMTQPEPGDESGAVKAIRALESYRKKDPSKSEPPAPPPRPRLTAPSRRPLQGGRQCPHHEAELLQDQLGQPLPGRHPVSQEGARVAGRRTPGEALPAAWPHTP